MNQKFLDFMRPYMGHRMAVAVSGGVDSMCLMHWLKDICADIVVLHVNHGLRACADVETQYLQDTCAKMNIECHTFYWLGEKPASGIEAAARTARYRMMTDWCRENGVEYLLTAHQADDQIETFFMNLGRGSGLYGLASMRPVSIRDGITILRPLLGVSRDEVERYCVGHNIRYFTDEMNSDAHYTRVRIRQNRRAAQELLGISDARILLAIENLARTRDTVDADVANLVARVVKKDAKIQYAMFIDSFLFDLMPDIRLKFIGTLIQTIGGDCYQPRLKSLTDAVERLRGNTMFTLGHCTLRRLNEKILIVPEGAKTSFRKRNEKREK